MWKLRKKRRALIRPLCGTVLGLGGVLLVVHTVPITVWYLILIILIIALLFLLLVK